MPVHLGARFTEMHGGSVWAQQGGVVVEGEGAAWRRIYCCMPSLLGELLPVLRMLVDIETRIFLFLVAQVAERLTQVRLRLENTLR